MFLLRDTMKVRSGWHLSVTILVLNVLLSTTVLPVVKAFSSTTFPVARPVQIKPTTLLRIRPV